MHRVYDVRDVVTLTCALHLTVVLRADERAAQTRRAPTKRELDGLRTLEHQVDDVSTRASDFRWSIHEIVARAQGRRVTAIHRTYARQITEERRVKSLAHRAAIETFERFLAAHGEDPEHTPDVMFRLAALYFDEAACAKLKANKRADRRAEALRARGVSIEGSSWLPSIFVARCCSIATSCSASSPSGSATFDLLG
jgi:hypothetical protein